MTDLTAGSASEANTDDSCDIGLSVGELQYLLSVSPGPAADQSALVLGVAPVPSVDETITFGAASLLAHGLVEMVDGPEFRAVGPALVVSCLLTTARRWSTIAGATEDAADTGVYIESAEGALLAQPRALGTWWFIVLDPASAPEDVVVAAALELAESDDASGVFVQTTTGSLDRTFSVRRVADSWSYAFGDSGAETPEETREGVGAETAFSELASFIRAFPQLDAAA